MLKVLVVDDDLVTRAVVRHIMTNLGLAVVEAVDAVEALEQIELHEVNLVICDQEMPGMTGLELRETLGEKLEVPFVLLTGYAEAEELDHPYSSVDGYLTKPVSSNELRDLVQKLTALAVV